MNKVGELQKLDIKELKQQINQEKEELQRIRIAHALDALKNPMQVQNKKRNIARMMTIFVQKRKK